MSPYFTKKQRLKIALGGLLFLIGIITLIFIILTLTKIVSSENINQYYSIIGITFTIVGVLDIIAGILLAEFK